MIIPQTGAAIDPIGYAPAQISFAVRAVSGYALKG
jgi:hypothetical protein